MSESLPDPSRPSNPHQDFIRRIRLIEGDITQQHDVDAIATAVDVTLDTSRSLNQALLRAAGQAFDDSLLENVYHPRTGDIYVLSGYGLPVRHIIVAITPVWRSGDEKEDRDLLRCYRGLLEMAARMELKTLALPALGTGKHKFPVARAARLALQAIRERMPEGMEELRIVCSKPATYDAFAERLRIIQEGFPLKPA